MRPALPSAALLLALATPAPALGAQPAAAARDSVRGVVRAPDGAPIPGANVFLLGTLDGAVADSAGRFAIARPPGALILVARALDRREVRRALAAGAPAHDVVLVLGDAGQALGAVQIVEAGRHAVGGERGASLGPLDVVTAPGAAADVNRALQMLPGVQPVDEGTGLFVRGGDYTETRTFVDGALLPTPVDMQRPSGTFVGTVDPFLLDGIVFSSGGFGARWGDALSAVADLRTQGRPTRATATASAGLAALSAAAGAPLPGGAGVRVAVNRMDLAPLLRVNGSPRAFAPAPHGADLSASVHVRRGGAGAVKLFAVRQTNALGLGVDDAGFAGTYATDVGSHLAVLRWDDVIGRVAPEGSVSSSGVDRVESYGAFRLRSRLRVSRAQALVSWARWARVTARAGAELERTDASFDGSVPAAGDDRSDGARTRVLGSTVAGTRDGAFAEADWRPVDAVRVIAGARTDRSTLTGRRTLDPRLSLAVAAPRGATLTAAWGVYHQVPDPLFFDPVLGVPALAPMRATHAVLGAQLGDETAALLRVEAYDKRYHDLAQQTRDWLVVPGGTGHARGVDVFARGPLALGVTGRVAYSLVDARRTDPHTGRLAAAPAAVTHAVTAVVERPWGARVRTAAAWRQATGRPIAPVTGAEWDAARGVWAPRHGMLGDERLPAFQRLDLNASWLARPASTVQLVAFAGLTNALDRANVHAWAHSADYAERVPVRSVFGRAVYVGASVTRF